VDGGAWERAFKRGLRDLSCVYEIVVVEEPANDAQRRALLAKVFEQEHLV
jgi:hypothetical protein